MDGIFFSRIHDLISRDELTGVLDQHPENVDRSTTDCHRQKNALLIPPEAARRHADRSENPRTAKFQSRRQRPSRRLLRGSARLFNMVQELFSAVS
jgi:hypothetical protein